MQVDITRCPPAVVAAVLGVTTEQIRLRYKAGVYEQTAKGKYDLVATVAAERAHQSKLTRGPAVVSLETARLKRAQAERAELDNDARRGSLLPLEEVKLALSEVLITITGMMDGIGSRLASSLAAQTDPAMIRRLILDETRRVRAHAAERLAGVVPVAARVQLAAPAAGEDARPVGRRKPRAAARKRRARAVEK